MSRRIRPHSSMSENLRLLGQIMPWRVLILVPVLLLIAIPTFVFGTDQGHRILPGLTKVFSNLSNATTNAVPTPMPPLSTVLPQPGSIAYSVRESDSCDEILVNQMSMSDAGQIFTDTKPATITALNSALGQNCNNLQSGDVVTLMPQYPLVALGGKILKVNALSPAQPIPTPLIPVQREKQVGVDCSNGCLLTVRIAEGIEVKLSVQTAVPVPVGAWVWAQAALQRKAVAGFPTYPYVDSSASLNGMQLSACDLQINDTHDDNSLSCDQLSPNTIDDDGGSWLLSVTGRGALDHWNYQLHLPSDIPVLLWLSLDGHGNLVYRHGNPLYRYDDALHLYVHI